MGSFICLLFLLLPAWVVVHAVIAPGDYWKAKLPNTAMPSAIRALLQPDVRIRVDSLADPFISMDLRSQNQYSRRPSTQLHGMPYEEIFFFEEDLRLDRKMRQNFTRVFPGVALVPRREASTFPFSSKKLPAILGRFSVRPNSPVAKNMAISLHVCEHKQAAEDVKYCATSLESMVDFAISTLQTQDLEAVSSEVIKEGTMKQQYVIASTPQRKFTGNNNIVCHPLPWPFAVFHCHITSATRVHVVPLVGEDGARVDGVAVCHTDTSAWDPRNLAFQMLKVKPGTVPICHFLPQGGIVWGHSTNYWRGYVR